MRGPTRLAAAALLPPLAIMGAQAGELDPRASGGSVSLVIENDAIFRSDRNYTAGLLLAYVSGEQDDESATRWLGRHLLFADAEDRVRFGVAAGQSLYTPDRSGARAPLTDEHPYAGWLYGALSLVVESEDALDTLTLDAGVVGPSAQAEESQDLAHEVLRSRDSKGWSHQLHDEVAFALAYDRRWRLSLIPERGGLELDILPNVGFAAGTVLTQASAGLTVRIGDDLRNDFGPMRIRPALGGSGPLRAGDHFAGHLFLGIEGRAVARNIFLDGNTYRISADVDRRPFVADVQAGAALQLYAFQTGITVVMRTSEFEPQTRPDFFGSLFIALRL